MCRSLWLIVTFVLLLTTQWCEATAGVNASGTLLFHHPSGATFDPQSPPACDPVLGSCGEAVARIDGAAEHVTYLYAPFLPETHPLLQGTEFRLILDGDVSMLAYGACDGTLLLTRDVVGLRATLQRSHASTDRLIPLAWFALRGGDTGSAAAVALLPLPEGRALFFDDGGAPDLVVDVGTLGVNADGFVPCPEASNQLGACCTDYGCFRLLPEACQHQGVFWGTRTLCDTAPCIDNADGACCLPDQRCEVMSPATCGRALGTVLGPGVECDPAGCTDPRGACCLNFHCILVSPRECVEQYGTWLGQEVNCEVDPCLDQITACCLYGGCALLSIRECEAAGGFLSGATECDPFLCWPATKGSSWGGIKARYR